jgi:prevent-host-death family protein
METTSVRLSGGRVVGVRDAKAQLSRLLQDVQRGGEWTITERGKPIARLVPISRRELSLAERIARLENVGTIEPAPHRTFPVPPPLRSESGVARRLLDDERNGLA